MKTHALLLIVALLFAIAQTGNASPTIYRWVDENGVSHFSDIPPDTGSEPEVYVPQRANLDSSPMPKKRPTPQYMKDGSTKRSKRGGDSVELYSTTWCPACKDAKKWLRRNRIPYTEYDIEKDKEANQRYRRLGSGGKIPFAVINGTKIVGFSPSQYKSALEME